MTKYNRIVIGAGIGGLYCCYRLLEQDPNSKICLIEKNCNIGGKIEYLREDKKSYVLGAGRLAKSQKLVMDLIDQLGLNEDIVDIGSDVDYYTTNGEEPNRSDQIVTKLLKKILEIYNQKNKEELLSMNVIEGCRKYLGEKDAQDLLNQYNYLSELQDINLLDGVIKLVEMSDDEFFVLKNGLDSLTGGIFKRIKDRITFYSQEEVKYIDLSKNEVGTDLGRILTGDCIIAALPKTALQSIKMLGVSDDEDGEYRSKLDRVTDFSIMRIHATYDGESPVWFKDMGKFTVEPPIKFAIPMGEDDRQIMISYVDSDNANIMYEKYLKGELVEFIESNMKKIFGDKYTQKIDQIRLKYYPNSLSYWGKDHLSYDNYRYYLLPFPDRNFHIVGDSFSLNQAWIDGALDSVDKLMDILH